ncbi:hypothetical protein E2C01_089156 [Portunus trituberculatus]|uniref:Uncharacterized protein n=1 Tax=Portunus trituberculatus TaxID=210409 RepID=A0A5B7JIC1_PORTR|nr:hypothetical protein [Portunus trituberculatus]
MQVSRSCRAPESHADLNEGTLTENSNFNKPPPKEAPDSCPNTLTTCRPSERMTCTGPARLTASAQANVKI